MMNTKLALVTGATSGIGKKIALDLARQNITVCINFSKSVAAANKVLREIKQHGGNGIIYQADITNEEEVRKMFAYLSSHFKSLDILINNAGIYKPSFIEEHNYIDWKNILDVNLNGKFLCTKYAVPLLRLSKHPRIINIASRCAEKADEESSAYCCSAAAITMLTKVSALELAKYNIKVNTVSPGLTKTFLSQQFSLEGEFEEYAQKNPSHRIGKVDDISNVVNFLISEKADFINGENINVSGGILLR